MRRVSWKVTLAWLNDISGTAALDSADDASAADEFDAFSAAQASTLRETAPPDVFDNLVATPAAAAAGDNDFANFEGAVPSPDAGEASKAAPSPAGKPAGKHLCMLPKSGLHAGSAA